MSRPRSATLLLLLAALLLPGAGFGQFLFPGPDFQVNTQTANRQSYPSVAIDGQGNFVVVWASAYQDGGASGVFGQRFASDGGRLGAEFQVNGYTPGTQTYPTVAMGADGEFLVAWQSEGQDGDLSGVFARSFSSAGVALSSELQVNEHAAGQQFVGRVAPLGLSDFMVVWTSLDQDGDGSGVFGRRLSTNPLLPVTIEFRINEFTSGDQMAPVVARADSDELVVAWQSAGQDGSGAGIFARRLSSAGIGLGSEFQVNVYATGDQIRPALAMHPGGDFVIAWTRDGGTFARRFLSSGAPVGGDVQVSTSTAVLQQFPAVAATDDGDFVVAWESGLGMNFEVLARRLSNTGTTVGPELQVNRYTPGAQGMPAIAPRPGGGFVVVWRSGGQDGSDYGIFGQRFGVLAALDLDGNGQLEALSDGLLLLRYLFGFTGATLTNGAVAPNCTRCDAAAILAHIATLDASSPLGNETQANLYATSHQRRPATAKRAGGAFVVVWQSSGQDGDGDDGVFLRRFSSAGKALGDEHQVNLHTVASQRLPAVASDGEGDFVVVWESAVQDGDSYGLFASRFTSVGDRIGGEFQVNSFTAFGQRSPVVAAAASGGFAVAWESPQDGDYGGIFVRPFASDGTPLATELQVNSFTTDEQRSAAIAADGAGDFVVAWQSSFQDGGGAGIFARRVSSSGTLVGGELQVNSYTVGQQARPTVGAAANGDFVVAWQSFGQDGNDYGVFSRRFSSAGAPLAAEIQVNTYTSSSQSLPRLSARADGGFDVAWQSYGQDGSSLGVFRRRLSSTGTPVGGELQVNSYTPGSQDYANVAVGSAGDFVVAWESLDQDGSSYGVFVQSYSGAALFDIDGDGSVQPLTDGLLFLRYLFGFSDTTLTSGAVGPDCTRCDAGAIVPYLQTVAPTTF